MSAQPSVVTPGGEAYRGLTRRYRVVRGQVRSGGLLYAGLLLAGLLAALAVGSLFLGDFDPNATSPVDRLQGIGSAGHVLGTDELGRDLLARALAGFRWSCMVAGFSACIVTVVGTFVGILAGALQGRTRVLMIRSIDIVLSLPGLVVAVAILAVLGRGFWPLTLTLSVVGWALVARVVYAETLGLMKREYILASQLMGLSRVRILLRHVVPGLLNTVMVMWAFVFADLIVAESSLSFLGLGADLGDPSLGTMLSDGRQYIATSPAMTLVPGVGIVLAVVAANMLGDGLARKTGAVSREAAG